MRLRSISYCLLTFSVLRLLPAAAQLPGMKIYTQLDGFAGTAGYHISQDSRGFIWVGTNNGAVCFDGKRFRVVDDKDGLTDKEILYALPYSENDVLLQPLLNNLALYKNGKVITAAQHKNLGLVTNKISNTCNYDRATGKVWLSDGKNRTGTVYCFRGDSIEAVTITAAHRFDIFAAINDRLYLLNMDTMFQWESLGIYDLQSKTYTPFRFVYPKGSKRDTQFWNYTISDDGSYVAAAHAGNYFEIFRISGSELRYIRTITFKQHPKSMYIDRNGHFWTTLFPSGIVYWGSLSGNEDRQKPLYFLENTVINHLFVDRDDNVWLTTEQKGLCFISSKHWQNARLELPLGLPPYPPTFVSGNGSSLYIGHSGKSGFTHIQNGRSTVFKIPGGSPLGIRAMLETQERLFVVSNVLAEFSRNRNGLAYKRVWSHGAIKDLAAYGNRQLLLAEHGDLALVNISELNDSRKHKEIFEGRTTAIDVLPDSSLLVGTPNGLFLKPSLYKPAIVINSAYITNIEKAVQPFVLIGTNARGLHVYNASTRTTKPVSFPANNGPASVRSIFRQNDSIYWLATDKGASKILFGKNMAVKGIVIYTFFDGLPSNDVTSVYVQHDTAYVATAAGLGVVPLKSPSPKSVPSRLWLTAIRIEDSLVYFPGRSIELAPHQNNIQLSLSAPAYESMGTMRFNYRLLGLSNKWRETENPEISFSGLVPGSYRFEAYAVSPEGLRGSAELVVTIIVQPAFWQTTWFRVFVFLIVALLVALGVYLVVMNKKSKQYREMKQKKRLAELELEAIKAQINPHFVYNCLNSIQYFSYKNELETVKEYLDIFAKLIRQTMKYSQETFITLEEEVNYLGDYLKLEKVRFKDRLHYQLEVDPGLDPMLLIPSMLIQPYIENAMKHGVAKLETAGSVSVKFAGAPEGDMTVTIEDNGPGLPDNAAGSGKRSLGLRLAGSRAETYNQLFGMHICISFETCGTPGDMQGTRVKLLIPPVKHGDLSL